MDCRRSLVTSRRIVAEFPGNRDDGSGDSMPFKLVSRQMPTRDQ
jgi:hypothetical protein